MAPRCLPQLPREEFVGPMLVQSRHDRALEFSPYLQLLTAEVGPITKKLELEYRPIKPSSHASKPSQDAMTELAKSNDVWTVAASDAMRRWWEHALSFPAGSQFRAAGERARRIFERDFALSQVQRDQMLADARAWLEQEESPAARQARIAQLRQAQVLASNRITPVQYDYLNQLLEYDLIEEANTPKKEASGTK